MPSMWRRPVLVAVLLASLGLPAPASENALALWRQVSFPLENFSGFSSRFGWRTSPTGARRREFHSGLDMPAPVGTYIRAWADGQVRTVRYDGRCGWHVVVTSGDWTSTYCHISAVGVQEGRTVRAGEVVAAVGSTGRSTGPHLHWTLRHRGKLVDPELVLQAMQLAWQGAVAPEVAPAQDVPEEAQQSPLPVGEQP
jgi:murein DD-endopeptidase MepM/ murein hydrolase activator NlpD